LRAWGIRKSFGHVRALDGVDFELRPREIHAIVGDNGAGKSTLIKIFAGALRPDAGSIEIDGRPVVFNSPRDARDAGIETVYQDLALCDPLDAAENVFLGREVCYPGLLGRLGFVDRAAMRTRTREHLEDLAVTLPSIAVPVETFSGGQRQAVAVARAAVWGQRLLIMDEPVAALGVQQTTHVVDLMQRARDEKGLSVILISHNLPEVLRVADRVTVLRLGHRVGTVAAAETSASILVGAMTGAVASLEEGAVA
ncbi:MAG: ATP-binding cassette domain-containing protein, partial [Acidobacteriota bacterium]